MFTQEIQEAIIESFGSATGISPTAIKCSVLNGEIQSMSMQATKTEANGESTNTKLTIQQVANDKYKLSGAIENPKRTLQVDRTIVTSPSQLASVVRHVLVMARVAKKRQGILNKMRSYV
jgi:hypothetical protein